MHIFPIENSSADLFEIRSSALQCQQQIIPTKECFFENGGITESIRVNFRKIDISLYQTFAFSFRTDLPTTSFLSLITNLGEVIQVDLKDGYLIVINHLIHPIKFLTDGNFHRLSLDLKTLSLSFDESNGVSISLIGSGVGEIAELKIHLIAQITAMEFLPKKTLNRQTYWLCQTDSLGLLSFVEKGENLSLMSKQPTPFFDTQICWPGERVLSFCNCFGPNSALDRKQIAACNVPTHEELQGTYKYI